MAFGSEPRDVQSLTAAVRAGWRPKYVFFWGHRPARGGGPGPGCLSQWWPARFEVGGISYPTAEHFMMAEKARLFGDREALAKILACGDPGAAKALGRSVRGFDEAVWDRERVAIVVRGNEAKFSQSEPLGGFLAATGERVLVEASPADPIWGIGLASADEAASDPGRWRGLNLLGFALMEVRARLRSGGAGTRAG